MKELGALNLALDTLPDTVSKSISCMPYKSRIEIREILLRTNKPVIIACDKGFLFLGNGGRLSKLKSSDCIVMSEDMMRDTFLCMCHDSVYSFMDNISSGFLTLPGGNRVGVCGRFVRGSDGKNAVRDITSLSVRIAAEHMGIGFELLKIYKKSGLGNTLVVGPPCSGKTTFLRDVCRLVSADKKVSLIDERCEISGDFDVGTNTDIYLNYNKYDAIEMSVRTMSPQVVIFDEIGKNEELKLVLESMNTGVKFIFSMHAENYDELRRKEGFLRLKNSTNLKYLVFLERENPGSVKEVLVYDENRGDYAHYDGVCGAWLLSEKPKTMPTICTFTDEMLAS